MIVNVLVTVPKPELFDSCMLCFQTIRTGFPTATLRVTINESCSSKIEQKIIRKAERVGADVSYVHSPRLHHAEWIRETICKHLPESGPCVIVDSDTIFWKSCEDWTFDTPLAGYYVPLMWNDFSQCVSFERLHTSFLYIRDTHELLELVKKAYPNALHETGPYCPVDPFYPRVQFIKGVPFFWDSCAGLYNMVGGSHFTEWHLEHYEHLNSAAFYDVMHERLENKAGFEMLHTNLVKTPEQLRNLWQCVHPYYEAKHQQALQFLRSAENFGAPALQSLIPALR